MSDHLLRLARIVESLAAGSTRVELYAKASEIIRDLEAAPKDQEKRTITREEFDKLVELLAWDAEPEREAVQIVELLRLTVEG